MPQLATYELVPALDDPGTWRVLGGTTYFLVAAALVTLGVGTLLRSTAATVETLVGYLPPPASTAFIAAGPMVIAAYAVVPMVTAAVALRRRDA